MAAAQSTGLVFSGAVMSHPRPARNGGGGNGAAILLIELKQRVLAALSKLGDRDTQQIATEELERMISETLTSDTLPIFLSCLYDTGAQPPKGAARKECIRLFATLATARGRGDWLAPHFPKIITTILRRLRDPDTAVRDACVETLGTLSEKAFAADMSNPTSGSQLLLTFSKPLFEALSEQDKCVQIGASMCLAKVIECTKNNPPLAALQRLCPRICRLLASPNLLAKASLLLVLGSLSQVKAVNQQSLNMVLPCIHEAMESSDWATRKAAADTLARMATNLGPALATFKSSTMLLFDSCKFDKVKPVRESIQEAMSIWKSLPDAEAENSEGIKPAELKANEAKACSESGTDGDSSEALADKVLNALKKWGAPVLADKKPNPEFFQNLQRRALDDWEVEVAVPRGCPPLPMPPVLNKGQGVVHSAASEELQTRVANDGKGATLSVGAGTGNEEKGLSFPNGLNVARGTKDPNEFPLQSDRFPSGDIPPLCNASTFQTNTSKGESKLWLEVETDPHNGLPLDTGSHIASSIKNGSYVEGQPGNVKGNWYFLRRQLSRLEWQQSNVMEMLQGFMDRTRQSMLVLESRVEGLERIVEDLTLNISLSSATTLASNAIRASSNYMTTSEGRISKLKGVDRYDVLGCATSGFNNGRDSSRRVPSLADLDDFVHGGLTGTCLGWGERCGGFTRLGEGPSARSVWQASKEEATLEAIRVAATGDGGASDLVGFKQGYQ